MFSILGGQGVGEQVWGTNLNKDLARDISHLDFCKNFQERRFGGFGFFHFSGC